jgi:hypothetical protein
MSHEHYFIDVSAYDRVDVYRLIELAGITCPVAQHVFKKAFATGKRGHKDLRRDWQDIADSAARRLQMIDEDAGWTDGAIRAAAFGQQNTIDCRSDEQKGFNDPRTVEGVDVAFETEKHMNFAPVQCEHYFEDHGCYRFGSRGQQLTIWNCAKCGAEKVEAEDE